jgi:hypothetical protein
MNPMTAMACAYTAIGHATADPATTLLKSRRLMVAPRLKKGIVPAQKPYGRGRPMKRADVTLSHV